MRSFERKLDNLPVTIKNVFKSRSCDKVRNTKGNPLNYHLKYT